MLIQNQILFMQLGYCWVDNDGVHAIVRKWQVVKRKGTSYSYWTSAPCGWLLKCCHEHLELLVTLLCPYLFLNTNKIMSSPHFYTHQQLMYFKWEFLLWIWGGGFHLLLRTGHFHLLVLLSCRHCKMKLWASIEIRVVFCLFEDWNQLRTDICLYFKAI